MCITRDDLGQDGSCHNIFTISYGPFPDFLTGTVGLVQPHQGVIDMDPGQLGPASISAELPVSHGHLPQLPEMTPPPEVWTMGGVVLLGLVISILNKVVTWHKQYLYGPNVCYDRMRGNWGINDHNPPFLSFLEFFFFFTFPLKHPVE
jgi:hypothetical protein